MTFLSSTTRLQVDRAEEYRAKGIVEPIVASLERNTKVERSGRYDCDRIIVAEALPVATPVESLRTRNRRARNADLLGWGRD